MMIRWRAWLIGLLAVFLAAEALAQPSFSAATDWIPCNGGDQVVVWLPASTYNGYPVPPQTAFTIGAGAGPDFSRPFTIVGTSIAHFTSDPGAYALIGHSGVNGDLARPHRGRYTPGEHIDVHTYCTVGHFLGLHDHLVHAATRPLKGLHLARSRAFPVAVPAVLDYDPDARRWRGVRAGEGQGGRDVSVAHKCYRR